MTAVGSAAPGPVPCPVLRITLVAAFGSYEPALLGSTCVGSAAPGASGTGAGAGSGVSRAPTPSAAAICAGVECTPMPSATVRRPRARFSALGRRSGFLSRQRSMTVHSGSGTVEGQARLGAEVLVQDFERRVAAERRAARDQLVQQDARAVDVDGAGLRAALGGLGGDVRGRADEFLGAGQAGRVGEACDAEVGEHRVHAPAVLLEQDVRGLQVAVHDAVGVARGERVGDLRGQEGRGDRGERAVLAEVAVQVRAVDQVHDQGEEVSLDDQVTRPDDVLVREPEQDGPLPQEAHHDVRVVGELFLQDLDRDGLARLAGDGRLGTRRLPLAGPPDGARGAAPERLLEQVLAAYRPHVMRSLLVWLVPSGR
ncbi:hypothetical protein SALBM135S_02439 [Streptomyces alboniger]